jgi:hypothetical protein
LTGTNHVGNIDSYSPQLYSQTNIRYAKAFNSHFAFKINGSYTNGQDWVADNRTDIASTLNSSVGLTGADNPAYDEFREVVAAAPTGNQILPVLSGATIDLPVNSRLTGSPQQYYVVGKGALEVYLNGQVLQLGESGGWSEVGASLTNSMQIIINQDLKAGDFLTFRIDGTGGPGSGGASAPDDNFYTLPTEGTNSDLDYMLVYDVSSNSYKKMTRAVFLAGLSNNKNIRNVTADWTLITSDDLVVADTTGSIINLTLPLASSVSGKQFFIKKANNAPNDLILNISGGDLIDGAATFSFNANGLTNYGSLTLMSDGVSNWWIF